MRIVVDVEHSSAFEPLGEAVRHRAIWIMSIDLLQIMRGLGKKSLFRKLYGPEHYRQSRAL